MWHKIGSFLDYPENWCQFAIRVVLYPLAWLFLGSLILFCLFLPVFFHFIMEDNEPLGVKVSFYLISGIMSGMCWVMVHVQAYKYNKTYEEFVDKLVDKIPDCPKIDWHKNEFK